MKEIYTKCPRCGSQKIFVVTDEQYEMYQSGDYHIQDIFPELSAASRERLISGICGKCWDELFKFEEE